MTSLAAQYWLAADGAAAIMSALRLKRGRYSP